MKFRIILNIVLSLSFFTSFSQEVKGDWVLENLIVKGGQYDEFDKMLLGDGLEIHLGKKSHLSITVLHDEGHRVKHKDTWFEGETFIILNDREWGNSTYNILKINKNEMVLERFVKGGVEIILEFVRRNKENHHHHNFMIIFD